MSSTDYPSPLFRGCDAGSIRYQALGAVPKNYSRNISILGSLSCYGMEAVMTIEGAVDATVFCVYVRHVLTPTLRAGDVVVMDNLSVHKVQEIEALITATGVQLIYLQPYSPDYSPIESCWGKLKTCSGA